jgi:3-oxoacyl-[acyl-carrier-protein] synthase-3
VIRPSGDAHRDASPTTAPSAAPRQATTVGIPAIAYTFAGSAVALPELAARGALESQAAMLADFGFDRVHVADAESPYDLALATARRVLQEHDIDPATVDAIICGGAPSSLAFAPARDASLGATGMLTTGRFRYPGTRLQHDLGCDRATVLGIDQLACTSLFGAVRVARALCAAEGMQRVLCVASEFFPAHAGREALYNCTSDAACALLVERGARANVIGAMTTVSKGYYWDADAMREEVVASYFPTAVHVVERTLADAGWSRDDVTWVMPHNISTRSWKILMGLLRLPNARLWDGNIALRGHTLAGDNFINLRDALDAGAVPAGARVLLFAYGYGAHWTALALEA